MTYRFSIIPAGAVTDPNLEARDLQVLCLLGRHTDKLGWCYRSQVKMAGELNSSRGSVQRSLDRLYAAGWVQKKARGNAANDETARPHTAHAYRVCLDRDDIPDHVLTSQAPDDSDDADQGGCPPVGTPEVPAGEHGGAQPCMGTGAQPYVGTHVNDPLEPTQDEPKRETRARDAGLVLSKFQERWPTAIADDEQRTARAWVVLPPEDQKAAIDGIAPFLAELKRLNRKHPPSGWKYLEERRWEKLSREDADRAAATFRSWSQPWWAWIFKKIALGKPVSFQVEYTISGKVKEWRFDDDRPSEDDIARLQGYPSDGVEFANWRQWFADRRVRFPEFGGRFWVYLPGPAPGVNATGPPSSMATDDDLQELAKG